MECEILLKYSSFLFKIIYKSMVLKLEASGELKEQSSRPTRFSDEFVSALRGLMAVLIWEIQQRRNSSLTLCKDLCRNMANFLNDLFSIMDRSIVLNIVCFPFSFPFPSFLPSCFPLFPIPPTPLPPHFPILYYFLAPRSLTVKTITFLKNKFQSSWPLVLLSLPPSISFFFT